jgi:hypothetical protein
LTFFYGGHALLRRAISPAWQRFEKGKKREKEEEC